MLQIRQSAYRPLRRYVLVGLVTVFCVGCGNITPSSEELSVTPAKPDQSARNALPQSAARLADREPADSDPRSRTKWVGDIPYDVFYDQPLQVAADDRSVGSVVTGDGSGRPDFDEPNGSLDPAGVAAQAANPASAGVDWQQLADINVLNAEVKQIRNRLTGNLRTVATYNRNLDAVANDAVILSAVAAVIAVHPGSLSWQDNAPAVRDLASILAANASGSGREAFSAVQIPFEQIIAILNGGPPAEGDAAVEMAFSEIAERSELMKRIKQSFNWLKSEINTESRFQESPEEIVREATLLAVFGGIVSTDSYDLADEPLYQQFVREFIEGNVGMATAVNAGDYQDFTTARDRVQNSCAACHGEYAFGDEGL